MLLVWLERFGPAVQTCLVPGSRLGRFPCLRAFFTGQPDKGCKEACLCGMRFAGRRDLEAPGTLHPKPLGFGFEAACTQDTEGRAQSESAPRFRVEGLGNFQQQAANF